MHETATEPSLYTLLGRKLFNAMGARRLVERLFREARIKLLAREGLCPGEVAVHHALAGYLQGGPREERGRSVPVLPRVLCCDRQLPYTRTGSSVW